MCNSHDSDRYSNNNKHAHADDDSQDYPDLAFLGCRSVGDGWSRWFWRDKQKTKFTGNVSFPTSHKMTCFKLQSQRAVLVTVPTAFPEGFSSGTPKRPRDSDLRLYATEKQYLLTIGFEKWLGYGSCKSIQKQTTFSLETHVVRVYLHQEEFYTKIVQTFSRLQLGNLLLKTCLIGYIKKFRTDFGHMGKMILISTKSAIDIEVDLPCKQ